MKDVPKVEIKKRKKTKQKHRREKKQQSEVEDATLVPLICILTASVRPGALRRVAGWRAKVTGRSL